jgi:UDP-N-acetylmuramate--alanine ligase
MNIYFSGLGGVGIGPLAQIAFDAGHTVTGSDISESLVTQELEQKGIPLTIGQDGTYLRETNAATPFDWFVYTAALPADHPELIAAQELGIRTGKRDEFLAEFIKAHNLKLIAISGTHGKTTTTGMTIWALKQLGIPISYSVGTTISFGSSGAYEPGSEYFIYECDEYDRNLLHFSPYLSLLTSIDYDHPDTYPTEEEYKATFRQYIEQSEQTIAWKKDIDSIDQPSTGSIWSLADDESAQLSLPGEHNRRNATLVLKGLEYLQIGEPSKNASILENFPGTDRRFEKLADNLYSDYGHHPEEIAATLQLAREVSDSVVLVYQPHQNWRQHFIRDQYTNQFELAEKVYWLPTYLTRENPEQATLTPQELTVNITNKDAITYAQLDPSLWDMVQKHRDEGKLVLLMGAGTIDSWVREQLRVDTIANIFVVNGDGNFVM